MVNTYQFESMDKNNFLQGITFINVKQAVVDSFHLQKDRRRPNACCRDGYGSWKLSLPSSCFGLRKTVKFNQGMHINSEWVLTFSIKVCLRKSYKCNTYMYFYSINTKLGAPTKGENFTNEYFQHKFPKLKQRTHSWKLAQQNTSITCITMLTNTSITSAQYGEKRKWGRVLRRMSGQLKSIPCIS